MSGAAFPVLHCIDGNWQKEPLAEYSGMTLRDYFAGRALPEAIKFHTGFYGINSVKAAEAAYHVADAMLAARGEKS